MYVDIKAYVSVLNAAGEEKSNLVTQTTTTTKNRGGGRGMVRGRAD